MFIMLYTVFKVIFTSCCAKSSHAEHQAAGALVPPTRTLYAHSIHRWRSCRLRPLAPTKLHAQALGEAPVVVAALAPSVGAVWSLGRPAVDASIVVSGPPTWRAGAFFEAFYGN